MKITKSRLKQIIKEELEESYSIPPRAISDANLQEVNNLLNKAAELIKSANRRAGNDQDAQNSVKSMVDEIHRMFGSIEVGTPYHPAAAGEEQYSAPSSAFDFDEGITKSRLKQIIKEQIEATLDEETELTQLQPAVDSIFGLITKEIEKTPELQRGILWSALMSKIAEAAKEGEGSELQDVAEVLDPDADVGDYIKDFKKSDAPQFKGKSNKKRKQMAIAAALSEEDT